MNGSVLPCKHKGNVGMESIQKALIDLPQLQVCPLSCHELSLGKNFSPFSSLALTGELFCLMVTFTVYMGKNLSHWIFLQCKGWAKFLYTQ